MNIRKFQDIVVYEIHPQSFKDTNNDGVGDLLGIIQKLDYLQELGINFIWLNPIYVSPQKDNGYDVSNYTKINSKFGTMEDFKLLIKEAEKRNISIMMDMILNHCSTEHEWFKKALQGDKQYYNRFFFIKNKKGDIPNNWQSEFGGSAWEYCEELQAYYLHLFDKTQIDLNWNDESVKKDIYKIVNFWLINGVKGFRFDVINLISKPKKFINNDIYNSKKWNIDADIVHSYIKDMAVNTYNNYKDIVTVGELYATSFEHAIKYTNINSNELNMAFVFHHVSVDYLNNDKWSLKLYKPSELINILKEWQLKIQEGNGWLALFLNNHDQPRSLSRFGDPIYYRYESAIALAGVTLLLRGTPFLYQGEEFGMENNNIDNVNQLRDIESKNYYKILKNKGMEEKEVFKILNARSRDNSRTPMQWDNTKYSGFSQIQPWIDVNKNYLTINFKEDYNSDKSIFKSYQKLISLRKHNCLLKTGNIEFINLHEDVLSFYRKCENKMLLIIINLSKNVISINNNIYSYKNIIFNNYEFFNDNLLPYQLVILE